MRPAPPTALASKRDGLALRYQEAFLQELCSRLPRWELGDFQLSKLKPKRCLEMCSIPPSLAHTSGHLVTFKCTCTHPHRHTQQNMLILTHPCLSPVPETDRHATINSFIDLNTARHWGYITEQNKNSCPPGAYILTRRRDSSKMCV